MATIELTDEEMRDAAMAARSVTLRAALDAKLQSDPRIAAAMVVNAARYARLSDKFKGAPYQSRQRDLLTERGIARYVTEVKQLAIAFMHWLFFATFSGKRSLSE